MNNHFENETWLIDTGDIVVGKMSVVGDSNRSKVERLVYCLWIADYGMRNSGDLDTALDWYPDFQREAVDLAGELGLAFTQESFSLPLSTLQNQYFERFERICNEIKSIYKKA